eukprot:scaffold251871_cov14-Tisochrysis_lutea.AAC.2
MPGAAICTVGAHASQTFPPASTSYKTGWGHANFSNPALHPGTSGCINPALLLPRRWLCASGACKVL